MWLSKLFGKAKNINSDLSSQLKRQVRLKICGGCPNKRDDFRFLFIFKKKGVSQCGKCKCALGDKVMWDDEKCPINKW